MVLIKTGLNIKKINNYIKNLARIKHKAFLNAAFDELDSNPKHFWNMVKTKSKNCVYPKELYFNGFTYMSAEEKANAYNQHFYESFNSIKYVKPDITCFSNDNLGSLTLTEEV